MKNQLFFGQPTSLDYDLVLDMFSGTKINSNRTSSVPLVEFWKETDKRLQQLIAKIDRNINSACEASLCFEYPTKPLEGKGKASMTDLMLLFGSHKIAIEAKYTEYIKVKQNPVNKWLKKGKYEENRKLVLGYWKRQIKNFSYGLFDDNIQKIDYQFFHRTASACHDTHKACVVYQLFYNTNSEPQMEKYIEELRAYVKLINPVQGLRYFVWKVQTEQLINNSEKDPFQYMKHQTAYRFVLDEIKEIL